MVKQFCILILLVNCGPSVLSKMQLEPNFVNNDVVLFPSLMSTTGNFEKGRAVQDVFKYLLDVELQVKSDVCVCITVGEAIIITFLDIE